MRDEDRIFHMDDAVLHLPEGYVDRSVNMLEWPLGRGDRAVLVVQRERIGAERAFDDYIDAELKDYPRKFTAFRREKTDEPGIGWDVEVRHHAFRWKKDEDVLYNRQAFVRIGATVLVFTATAKAAHRSEIDEIVRRSLEGLRLRDD